MSEPLPVADQAVPAMAPGVRLRFDKVRESWILLAPERAMKLDQIAAAILERVDGERSLEAIVADLAATYSAPPEQIAGDVRRFVAGLLEKRMLELAS
jgi:pyrroloquinoline quinone biosynthesis protein D